MGNPHGVKIFGLALLVLSTLLGCASYCSGTTLISSRANVLPASAALHRRTLAALLPALSTDDATAISAVATCVQWSCGQPAVGGPRSTQGRQREEEEQVQIVGLLPAIGRLAPGGGWAPVTWHGRALPKRLLRKSQPFSVRLLQPNIYGVYNYLISTRRVELLQWEKLLKDGRVATVYELRPVSVWRRLFNNLV